MPLLDVLSDGCYELTPNAVPFGLVLRVDLRRAAAVNIVQISGDKVFRAGDQFVLQGSFKSVAFSPEAVQDFLRADVQYYGSGASATLEFTLTAANAVELKYTEGGATYFFAISTPVTPTLRTFVYTVDVEQGANFPPRPVAFGARAAVTVEECFEVAGIGLRNGARGIPFRADGTAWQLGELQAALANRIARAGQGDAFDIYLIIGNQYEESNVTGVMFDDQNRRGAAVFHGTLARLFSNRFDANFVRTIVHEIGHALNLPHAFESGSPADRRSGEPTFMNYPQNYTGRAGGTPAQRVADYWQDFSYTFANHEVGFICHGATIDLLAGGAPYAGESFDRTATSFRFGPPGAAPAAPNLRLELRLRPARHGNLFEFGEPVHVEAELTNTAPASQTVHKRIDPVTGLTRFIIRRPNGTLTNYQPPYELSVERNSCKLKGLESTHHDACLSYSPGGFTFIDPGRYELQAVCITPGGPVYSNVLPVWVRYPTREDENRLVPTFDPEVCAYLAAGGRPDLTRANDILEDFVDRPEFRDDQGNLSIHAHPLAHYFYRLKARLSVRGFRTLRQTRQAFALEWAQKPAPNYSLFRQALGLNAAYRMGATVRQRRHPFSNIVYGELAGELIRTLATSEEAGTRDAMGVVLEQVTEYLRDQKMKPYALTAYRRKYRSLA